MRISDLLKRRVINADFFISILLIKRLFFITWNKKLKYHLNAFEKMNNFVYLMVKR